MREINISKGSSVSPFLKWAGGKRWLTQDFSNLFPEDFNVYYEPFLGSGAVFFHLQPEKSILNDSNFELINSYVQIRDNWNCIEKELKRYHKKHSKEFYYDMRSYSPRADHYRASRFIYLNRTCWNGLYRVNLNGKFNVPIGSKKNVILDADDFGKLSKSLRNAELLSGDFEKIIDMSGRGDFLFVDPPYTVKHNNNGFVKYNENIFSWSDQIRLKESLVRAASRGARFVVTNANHASIRELYADVGEFIELTRNSVISGLTSGRGRYSELIIRN